ncbi:MAG: HNH/ENDO VII family nuclease [Gaiellaceae bacterium]
MSAAGGRWKFDPEAMNHAARLINSVGGELEALSTSIGSNRPELGEDVAEFYDSSIRGVKFDLANPGTELLIYDLTHTLAALKIAEEGGSSFSLRDWGKGFVAGIEDVGRGLSEWRHPIRAGKATYESIRHPIRTLDAIALAIYLQEQKGGRDRGAGYSSALILSIILGKKVPAGVKVIKGKAPNVIKGKVPKVKVKVPKAVHRRPLTGALAVKVTARVKLRKATRAAIIRRAKKNANGDFLDPNTGEIIPRNGPFDIGHTKKNEYRRVKQRAIKEGWTRQEFIEYENNPSHYQIESPHANRSHEYEEPGND